MTILGKIGSGNDPPDAPVVWIISYKLMSRLVIVPILYLRSINSVFILIEVIGIDQNMKNGDFWWFWANSALEMARWVPGDRGENLKTSQKGYNCSYVAYKVHEWPLNRYWDRNFGQYLRKWVFSLYFWPFSIQKKAITCNLFSIHEPQTFRQRFLTYSIPIVSRNIP